MPLHVRSRKHKKSTVFDVVDDKDKVFGTHESRQAAIKQIAAIESGKRGKKRKKRRSKK